MNLELPSDARVQIFIAAHGQFPSYEGSPNSTPLSQVQALAPPKRLILKSTAAALLLGGAYILGGASARHSTSMQAQAEVTPPSASAASTAAMAQRSAEVPQAFAQQLQQPATVTPPPGAPNPGSSSKSAFGLED